MKMSVRRITVQRDRKHARSRKAGPLSPSFPRGVATGCVERVAWNRLRGTDCVEKGCVGTAAPAVRRPSFIGPQRCSLCRDGRLCPSRERSGREDHPGSGGRAAPQRHDKAREDTGFQSVRTPLSPSWGWFISRSYPRLRPLAALFRRVAARNRCPCSTLNLQNEISRTHVQPPQPAPPEPKAAKRRHNAAQRASAG
jgi:hypothetical protein